MAAVSAEQAEHHIPRLVAGQDPSELSLSPAEGFLFSRIDGVTPWKLLREIGGLTPDEVDMCLESWVRQGLVELLKPKPQRKRPAPAKAEVGSNGIGAVAAVAKPAAPREPDFSVLDESLQMDLDTQKRILEFETKLADPYHTILGLERDCDTKAIKKAYFALSKEFHPDRYFRKEIGDFGKRLETVFKRITEAYELLSDPTVRAEIEKSMAAEAPPQPVAPPPDESPEQPIPTGPPRELTKLERLRARMPFKLPESFLGERRNRAREFWDAAQRSVQVGKYIEAASTVRLAIAFDPHNDEYRDGFGDIQVRAAELKAEALVAEAERAADGGVTDDRHSREILRLYEEALLYRPHSPELNDKAARAAIRCGQLAKAEEYSERAFEHSPDVAAYRITRALVHKARGNIGHAIKELEEARKVAPNDQEVSKQLAVLRRSARPSA